MSTMVTIFMVTAAGEPLSARQIIRDAIAAQLFADGYSIFIYGSYIIRVRPCNTQLRKKSALEIVNLPIFSIDFGDDCIVVKTIRATSVRTVACLEYADPLLMENLADALQPLGICLVV